jgi:hypothetical protein
MNWLDIDQTRLAENSNRIAIMDQNYRRGLRMLIWLAGWMADTPLLMEFLSIVRLMVEPLDFHYRFFYSWLYCLIGRALKLGA